MPPTPRFNDPTTIGQLVSKLESAFEAGCGPLSDEVKRLVDVSRGINQCGENGGYECARGLLRARFGPAADARPVAGGWPRLLLFLMTLLLTAIATILGIMAWMAWQSGPKVDRLLSSLNAPAELEFDTAPTSVVAGAVLNNSPVVKVYDRARNPVPGAEVEFTISAPTDTAGGAFMLTNLPSPLVLKKAGGGTTYDFATGFNFVSPSQTVNFTKAQLETLVTDVGGKYQMIQDTLPDGRASIPSLIILPRVGNGTDKFKLTARVTNSSVPLEKVIEILVKPGATMLVVAPDPPTPTLNAAIAGLRIQSSSKDKFLNPADSLPEGTAVVLSVLDDQGAPASDVTLASDDTAVTVKDATATGKTDGTGAVDFGKLKITKATKDKNYKVKAARDSTNAQDTASSVISQPFKVTGIP